MRNRPRFPAASLTSGDAGLLREHALAPVAQGGAQAHRCRWGASTPSPEVIEHAVWLYHCFSLSLRDVELILAARGVVVSYETSASGVCASAGSSPIC